MSNKIINIVVVVFIILGIAVCVHIFSNKFKIVHMDEYQNLKNQNDSLTYAISRYEKNIQIQQVNIEKLEKKLYILDSIRGNIERALIDIDFRYSKKQSEIDKIPVDSSYSYNNIIKEIGSNTGPKKYCFDALNTREIHKKLIELDYKDDLNKKLVEKDSINQQTIEMYKMKSISLNRIISSKDSIIDTKDIIIAQKDHIIDIHQKEIKRLKFWNTTLKITTVAVPIIILAL